MLCYQDKTFCPFSSACAQGKGCYRELTEKIKKEAEKTGLPLALYMEAPSCFIPIPPEQM